MTEEMIVGFVGGLGWGVFVGFVLGASWLWSKVKEAGEGDA